MLMNCLGPCLRDCLWVWTRSDSGRANMASRTCGFAQLAEAH